MINLKNSLKERDNRLFLLGVILMATGIYALSLGDKIDGYFFILYGAIVLK